MGTKRSKRLRSGAAALLTLQRGVSASPKTCGNTHWAPGMNIVALATELNVAFIIAGNTWAHTPAIRGPGENEKCLELQYTSYCWYTVNAHAHSFEVPNDIRQYHSLPSCVLSIVASYTSAFPGVSKILPLQAARPDAAVVDFCVMSADTIFKSKFLRTSRRSESLRRCLI